MTWAQARWRVTHALIFTAVYSRHMFVWLTFSQTLAAVIAGCEAAWRFFGGVFGVLVPDNASAIVADADAVNPRFTVGGAGEYLVGSQSRSDEPNSRAAVAVITVLLLG
ncbi:MAG TPA: hypothetical protein VGO16_04445 [Pseudonocardiaceae bacterium]|nr:hypothetical protein [Pseudonocardiaceae bacterium]